MRKTRESCICFSLALGGEIFANMHCEEFALLFTNTRAMGGADNQCGAGIMVYVVVLHVASLHGNCTPFISTISKPSTRPRVLSKLVWLVSLQFAWS